MEETKDPKATAGAADSARGAGAQERDPEATSSETLSDLEESERVPTAPASGSESSGQLEGATPSPDAGHGEDSGGPM